MVAMNLENLEYSGNFTEPEKLRELLGILCNLGEKL